MKEEKKEPFYITLDAGKTITTVTIPTEELDKLAAAIYWFCKENNINATIDIKENE